MPSAAPEARYIERFLAGLTPLLPQPDGRFGIALSGGPDSCALLILAGTACPGRVAAMIVDHGLRPESAAEAEMAATLCRTLEVPVAIASVTVTRSGKGLSAAARDARYAALNAWAVREGLCAILTAHHADDQAETLLMRLARGAGTAGLSGVRKSSIRDGQSVPIVRPLLEWRKRELEAIVAAAGIQPAYDPSNDDERYDRTRARRLLATTHWLDAGRLARAAHHLAEGDEAIDWMVDRLADAAGQEAVIDPSYPREIVRRLLLRLFHDRFAKHPDGPAVDRAMAALMQGQTVTLADILCVSTGDQWHFRPAPPRRGVNRSS